MNIPNQEETTIKWLWMVDWCKKNHHSPCNSYFWNKAHEAYCETFKPIP